MKLTQWPGVCQTGTQQSPIDLQAAELISLASANTSPTWTTSATVLNDVSVAFNGHSVDLKMESVSSPQLVISGNSFQLKGLHFHSPSEHSINGQRAELEAHFVHKDKSNNIAVLGVMFSRTAGLSASQPFFQQFINQVGF
jgi:carbonic anhydrase